MRHSRTYTEDCISLAIGLQSSYFNMNDVNREILLSSVSSANVTCALL